MIEFLGKLGLGGIFVLLVLLVIGCIQLFRYLINKTGSDILSNKKQGTSNVLVKKYHDVDVSKYSSLFGLIGLSISLLFILFAFEYPTYDEGELMDLGSVEQIEEEMIEIPPTQQQPPPPPKVTVPEIVEVKNEEEIEEEIEIELPEEFDEEMVMEEMEEEEEEEVEEVVDEIFEIVEENAEPKGGMSKFYKWVGKEIKYPSQAKRMGVEGKVYVQFVVGKDGTLTDIKVVRGIGAGCDEEAVRVLKNAAKWKAGKQRGRPVKQRMVLPISFKLG